MREYEIRILKEGGRASLIFESSQLNDEIAIRVAEKLSAKGAFEVWRGMDCICRNPPGNGERAAQNI
jgi:hypothetical protein